VCHENNEINVLATVNDNSQIRSRQNVSQELIKRSMLQILAKYKYHPYRINFHQDLHGTNFENRVTYMCFVSGCSIKCTLIMNFCH